MSGGIGGFGGGGGSQLWVSVKFGDNNVVVISPYLHQVVEPQEFSQLGIDAAQFKAFAIKSRVHFRRGFYDSGYARPSCWSNRNSRFSARSASKRCLTSTST